MDDRYRGDVTAPACWSALSKTEDAVLVDVRTSAEWTYVGLPQLASIGKSVILAEWQNFPSMSVDPAFAPKLAERLEAAGIGKTAPIYFLCRSGVRSIAGAVAMTENGFENCFNVLNGFEGPPDEEGHRGRRAGWKAEGLPWSQN